MMVRAVQYLPEEISVAFKSVAWRLQWKEPLPPGAADIRGWCSDIWDSSKVTLLTTQGPPVLVWPALCILLGHVGRVAVAIYKAALSAGMRFSSWSCPSSWGSPPLWVLACPGTYTGYIIESFQLEGTFKGYLVYLSCNVQGHL